MKEIKMDNDYEREEVVAKLIAIIDDAVKDLRKKGVSTPELIVMLHNSESDIYAKMESMKEDIKKYKIAPEEIFSGFLKADKAKADSNKKEIKTCVKVITVSNEDITSIVNGKEVDTSIDSIFSKRKSLRIWTRAFFRSQVFPEYMGLSKRKGGRPDSVLVEFTCENDVATVKTTCIQLDDENPQISDMDNFVKKGVDSSASAVEIRKLEIANLVACTLFIHGEIYEVNYFRVSKKGRIEEEPKASFRSKSAHDRWVKRLIEKTAKKQGFNLNNDKEDKPLTAHKVKPVNRIKFSEN